ncbi:MAG: restriction endonuclease subunit S [bacterium]
MKYVKIKEVILNKISGEWGKEADELNSTPVIRTANFRNNGKINYGNLLFRSIPAHKINTKKLINGDTIIEKSGGSPTQPVGRVVFFDNSFERTFLCNNFTSILRPNPEKVHPKYLFFALFYNHKIGKTCRFQNKTTGIINLQLDKYLESKIPLPPLEEQIKIADILSKAENLIEKRRQSIELLDEFIKSTFLEMFGDPVRNEKGWEKVKLGDIAMEFKYGTNTISDGKESDSKIPILRIPNIIGERIDYSDLKFSVINEKEKEKILLKKNDLLFVRTNGNPAYIGRCAVFNDSIECGYASYLIRLRLKESSPVSANFIKSVISFPTYRQLVIRKATTTAGNYNINTEGLKSLSIYFPPLPLQNQFAETVNKVEALKEKYQKSLEELENLYGSLSQKVFSHCSEPGFSGLEDSQDQGSSDIKMFTGLAGLTGSGEQ